MNKLLISIPVEPHGSINAQLADWLLRVVMQPDRIGKHWAVRWDIVHDKPVCSTRNRQCRRFLESDNEYVLFLDADMVPTDQAVAWLVDYITDPEVDVISGIADQMTKGGPMPVLWKWRGSWDKCTLNEDILSRDPSEGPFPLDNAGTGAACLLTKRSTLEKIAGSGSVWFRDVLCEDPTDKRFGGRIVGHDAWFFWKCHEVGLKPWIDTRAYLGHVKAGDLAIQARLIHTARREAVA